MCLLLLYWRRVWREVMRSSSCLKLVHQRTALGLVSPRTPGRGMLRLSPSMFKDKAVCVCLGVPLICHLYLYSFYWVGTGSSSCWQQWTLYFHTQQQWFCVPNTSCQTLAAPGKGCLALPVLGNWCQTPALDKWKPGHPSRGKGCQTVPALGGAARPIWL